MANASISGLVSGLDTATIISQLMQIEAQPQVNLKSRVSTQELQVNSLQTINSKLAGIATKAAELAQFDGWSATKVASSNENVTATADDGTIPATLNFTVGNRATAASKLFTTSGAADAVVAPANSDYQITYDDGRAAVTINTGDGSLHDIADAINTGDTGLSATLVKSGTDASGNAEYRLQVAAKDTGANSGFTFASVSGTADPFLGGPVTTVTGVDASITIAGQTVTSSSNTITDLMPGVDVTLGAEATGSVTITVKHDAEGLSAKVKAMVDAVNSALDGISSLTAYKSDTSAAGILSGDSTLRAVRDQLISSITTGVSGQTLADVGIQVDKAGTITFDESKFVDAYEADPVGTAEKFTGTITWNGTPAGAVELNDASWRTQPGTYTVSTGGGTGTIDGRTATVTGSLYTGATDSDVDGLTLDIAGDVNGTITYTQGLAAKLEAIAQRASDSTEGTVSLSIKNRNDTIDDLNDSIADWDVRLDLRRTSLERQYAALEVALGKLQSQSSWLAGQISSLPQISTGD